ncbi:N-acetylneuraminate synthase family protein, partial [Pelagibacteraceae bacterium]|nr:N-acetylneuraminate synthase family protein [Pelagibacteraceae bacterium]
MRKKTRLIIAEIGSNHDGNVSLAKQHIREAKKCNADVAKFQLHIAEEETLKNAPSPSYFKKEDRYSYFNRINFNFKQWKEIKDYCKKIKIEFLCSPFSVKAVDILEKLNVKYYKVPSGEVTNLTLLKRLKDTKKHIFISTGMSNLSEIENAIKIIKSNYTLMQCSSIYPCPNQEVGLNMLEVFKKRFNCKLGFSDHTVGSSAAYAFASNGADVIEKHFALSNKLYGSDAKHSMLPRQFKIYCNTIKDIWKITGSKINKNDLTKYKNMKIIFEKSIVAKNKIYENQVIRFNDIDFKKPG